MLRRRMRSPTTIRSYCAVKPMLILTFLGAVAAIVAVPAAGHFLRHSVRPLYDVGFGAAVTIGGVAALWLTRRRGLTTASVGMALAAAPVVMFTLLRWTPTMYVNTYREVAAAIRRDDAAAAAAAAAPLPLRVLRRNRKTSRSAGRHGA